MKVNFVPKLTEKKEVLALVADKKSILDFKDLCSLLSTINSSLILLVGKLLHFISFIFSILS